MESEFSGIFRVKLVTKNIERGSPGTQFMHMRVKSFRKFPEKRLSRVTVSINLKTAGMESLVESLFIKKSKMNSYIVWIKITTFFKRKRS